MADRSDETTSTFRLRRAELSVKGEIVSGLVGYALMIDPAKVLEPQDTTLLVHDQDPAPSDSSRPESVTAKQPVTALSALQDFYITYKLAYADVSLGQFKTPVSWEGYNSSSKLLFVERAPVSCGYGDKRDLGLRIAKTFKYLGYSAGLFNGAGLNNLDVNNVKDGALRLEAYPLEGLVVAGVASVSLWNGTQPNTKDRYEADLRYERGPFLLQAEYIRARDISVKGVSTHAQGFYAALAYTFGAVLQPCLRVGYLDPDLRTDLRPATAKDKDELWHFDAGLNWYLRGQEAKVQLDYFRFQYQDKTPNNEVILAAQVSY